MTFPRVINITIILELIILCYYYIVNCTRNVEISLSLCIWGNPSMSVICQLLYLSLRRVPYSSVESLQCQSLSQTVYPTWGSIYWQPGVPDTVQRKPHTVTAEPTTVECNQHTAHRESLHSEHRYYSRFTYPISYTESIISAQQRYRV